MRGLGDILDALRLLLPPWAIPVILGLVFLALWPGLKFRTRSRQVRESVRRLVRAPEEDRATLIARAFSRAGDDPHLLAILAREARKRAMPEIERRALDALEGVPGGAAEARRHREETSRTTGGPLHPLESVLRVETMIEEGLWEAARVRLDEALGLHPTHPQLLDLKAKVEAHRASLDEAGSER